MERRRFGISMALAGIMSVTILAAPASAQDEATTLPDLSGVTLEIWRKIYDNPGIDNIDVAFQERTGATLQVTKVPPERIDNFLPKWAAGERPDVLFVEGWRPTMEAFNVTENMFPVDDLPFTEHVTEALAPFGVIDGVRYWAPLTAPTYNGFLYNQKVADELGVEVPSTLEEMLAFCGQVGPMGKIPVVIGQQSTFMSWTTYMAMVSDFLLENPGFADAVNSGEADFSDPGFVARIQAIKDMKDAGCYEEGAEAVPFGDAMTKFMADEGIIFNCGNFCVPDLVGAFGAEAVDEKVRFLPISYSQPVVYLYGADDWGMYWVKTGDPEAEAAARAYIEFATGDGYDIYLANMPEPSRYPNHEVPDPEGLPVAVRESIQAAEELPSVAALDPVLACDYGDFFTFLAELFIGERTAAEVAEAMNVSFAQSCRDLGIEGF